MFAAFDTIRVKRSKKWRRFEHYALDDSLEIIFVQLVKTSSFDDRREGHWKEQINISTSCVMFLKKEVILPLRGRPFNS